MIACLSPSQIIRSRIEDRRNDEEYCCDEDGREINARKNRPSNEFANSTPAHTCTSTILCAVRMEDIHIYQRFRERCCATLVSLSGPHYFALSAFRRNYEGLAWPFKAGKFLSCSYIVSTAAALIMALDHERRSHFKTKLENYNVVTPLHA